MSIESKKWPIMDIWFATLLEFYRFLEYNKTDYIHKRDKQKEILQTEGVNYAVREYTVFSS